MKNFLAIFTRAENSKNHLEWMKLDKDMQKDLFQKGMDIQNKWLEKYKDQIILDGGHLGERTKLVDKEGIKDIPSKMGHFYVVKANSHEGAAEIFKDHPHFSIFPGDGIEILECTSTSRTTHE